MPRMYVLLSCKSLLHKVVYIKFCYIVKNGYIFAVTFIKMKLAKASIKFIFHRNILILLAVANVTAFSFTHSFFYNVATKEEGQQKDLVSKMYTGWQMLDWSFSLIDYFRNAGDR